jgi:hypothetical protein
LKKSESNQLLERSDGANFGLSWHADGTRREQCRFFYFLLAHGRHIAVVHAMFTTLLDRLFTNAIEMTAQASAPACVWRACIAD